MMTQTLDDDPSLGTLERFPRILHARASFVFDMKPDTLQRAIIHGLYSLQESRRSLELSLSDHAGYLEGSVAVKVGIGNQDGFDILDAEEEERVLRRIEERGMFSLLDVCLDFHYKVQGDRRHRVQGDRYLTRMNFREDRLELLVHHLKGLRRIQPDELIHFLLSLMNSELSKKGHMEVELETLQVD